MKTIVIKRADGGVSIGDIAEWADPVDVLRKWSMGKPAEWLPATFDVLDVRPTINKDRMFRNALKHGAGGIVHDIPKCKLLAHDMRRAKRDAEMKPFDDIITKQIPGTNAAQAEAARVQIRAKYDAMQKAIDAATDVQSIKVAL